MDDLDRMLDEAIGSYANSPGAVGVERRILNQVYRPRPAAPWWVWAGSALAAVALMSTVVREPGLPVRPAVVRIEPPRQVPTVVPARRVRVRRRGANPERALVAFLKDHPEQASHLLADDSAITIDPLEIEELP